VRIRSPSSRSKSAESGWNPGLGTWEPRCEPASNRTLSRPKTGALRPDKKEEIMTVRPLASRAADRGPVADVESRSAFLVRSEETNGQFSLAEGVLLRDRVPPPHIHHNEDEAFYVLEGELTIMVGDR